MQNPAKSKVTQGLPSNTARQHAVADTTSIADQGTQVLRAQDAAKGIAASNSQPVAITSAKSGQEAVRDASKGATR